MAGQGDQLGEYLQHPYPPYTGSSEAINSILDSKDSLIELDQNRPRTSNVHKKKKRRDNDR